MPINDSDNIPALDLANGAFPRSPRETLGGYIPAFIPSDKIVRVWFDVDDIEEGRI